MDAHPVILEFVDAWLEKREPEVITVVLRTANRRRKIRVSLRAARDLMAQLDYCVWKGGQTRR